jgi:hypothetical protein
MMGGDYLAKSGFETRRVNQGSAKFSWLQRACSRTLNQLGKLQNSKLKIQGIIKVQPSKSAVLTTLGEPARDRQFDVWGLNFPCPAKRDGF